MANKNNAKRGAEVLSLIVIIWLFGGCCVKQQISEEPLEDLYTLMLSEEKMPKYEKDYAYTIVILPDYTNIEFRFLDYTYDEKKEILKNRQTGTQINSFEAYLEISIRDFLLNYYIDRGIIINKHTKRQLLSQNFLYTKSGTTKYSLNFNKGKIYDVDLSYKEDLPFASIVYTYDRRGNITEWIDNISQPYIKIGNTYEKYGDNYQMKRSFEEGSGYWKIYYYEQNEELEYIISHIKEEGEVKNNYKVGEWKYYNKNGEIDSLKTYSIKDSVDVRFPHCLFNKNEPCY